MTPFVVAAYRKSEWDMKLEISSGYLYTAAKVKKRPFFYSSLFVLYLVYYTVHGHKVT